MDLDNFTEGYEDGEEPLTFHYSREHRLKTAPKLVQDYYNGTFTVQKKGFFRVLVATRANRLLLLSIGICLAVLMINVFWGRKNNQGSIYDCEAVVSAFSFEDTVYASVNIKKAGKKYPFKGEVPVSVSFNFLDADNQSVANESLQVKYDGNESFIRTTARDYDILKLNVNIEICDESIQLMTLVQKN